MSENKAQIIGIHETGHANVLDTSATPSFRAALERPVTLAVQEAVSFNSRESYTEVSNPSAGVFFELHLGPIVSAKNEYKSSRSLAA